jgi:hypothetical protein
LAAISETALCRRSLAQQTALAFLHSYERDIAKAKEGFGESQFAEAWRRGSEMSTEEAVQFATDLAASKPA